MELAPPMLELAGDVVAVEPALVVAIGGGALAVLSGLLLAWIRRR